jgi:hypothetical protein
MLKSIKFQTNFFNEIWYEIILEMVYIFLIKFCIEIWIMSNFKVKNIEIRLNI